jgi:hypothetical protein
MYNNKSQRTIEKTQSNQIQERFLFDSVTLKTIDLKFKIDISTDKCERNDIIKISCLAFHSPVPCRISYIDYE